MLIYTASCDDIEQHHPTEMERYKAASFGACEGAYTTGTAVFGSFLRASLAWRSAPFGKGPNSSTDEHDNPRSHLQLTFDCLSVRLRRVSGCVALDLQVDSYPWKPNW